MKFSVGYQHNGALKDAVMEFRDKIAEIYFPWVGFATGRGTVTDRSAQAAEASDLREYAAAGLGTNLLLNGNCYGRRALSRAFFAKIGDAIDELSSNFGLSSATTTSPLIAKFIKANFKGIEVRASVNMEIGTPEAAEYLSDYFDGFYMKREYNWNLPRLTAMWKYCKSAGKKLHILANSGCINFCPARTFHDNLVAHQDEIAEMDNAYEFKGLCHDYLSDGNRRKNLLSRSNFIRPEDIGIFEGMCDSVKLATRTNRNPSAVVRAYCYGRFSGNLWELTEPSHASNFYPEILANDKIPNDYARKRLGCSMQCDACRLCQTVQADATINLNTI